MEFCFEGEQNHLCMRVCACMCVRVAWRVDDGEDGIDDHDGAEGAGAGMGETVVFVRVVVRR